MLNAIDRNNKPNFKLAADIDFLSFLLCHKATLIPQSTHVWIVTHSIEKYLKAILEKNNEKITHTHDLKVLWSWTKKYIDKSDIFEEFILNLNTLEPKTRYLENIITYSRDFAWYYLILATYLRYIILWEEEYKKKDYGLEVDLIVDSKVKKMINNNLKLLFEDSISFSPIGIPDKLIIDFDLSILKNN